MTTIHQVFIVRSFRSTKDRDFQKALQIYDAHTHPQVKTDSREISYWLDNNQARKGGTFYVCGLYIGADLVGYAQFMYLATTRLIHFDYFIIDPDRRSAGAFYTFADQMRLFFETEGFEWDFASAEVAKLDVVNGVSQYAERLVRLFRQAGFSEVLADYDQPLLGIEHPDTAVEARLLVLPRVEMPSISKARYLELVSAIYHKHYGTWYSIYPETSAAYELMLETLLANASRRLRDKKELRLRGPDRDFVDQKSEADQPLRGALFYFGKIILSVLAAALFNYLLRRKTDYSVAWVAGISVSACLLLIVVISLTDKKRLEAFKLLISLISKLCHYGIPPCEQGRNPWRIGSSQHDATECVKSEFRDRFESGCRQ
jgi:hypothetical protein